MKGEKKLTEPLTLPSPAGGVLWGIGKNFRWKNFPTEKISAGRFFLYKLVWS